MSTGHIAVIDTDVLVLAVGDEGSKERTETSRARLKFMRDEKYTLWIPAPAIAELAAHGGSMQKMVAALVPRLGGLRIADFGMAAAETCGKMVAAALARATTSGARYDSTRAAMKFDAMIAAIAHTLGAKYLLTANARDMSKHLGAVASPTQIHRADEPNPAFAWQPSLPMDVPEGNGQPDLAAEASLEPSAAAIAAPGAGTLARTHTSGHSPRAPRRGR